jgi:hypothetical protein
VRGRRGNIAQQVQAPRKSLPGRTVEHTANLRMNWRASTGPFLNRPGKFLGDKKLHIQQPIQRSSKLQT